MREIKFRVFNTDYKPPIIEYFSIPNNISNIKRNDLFRFSDKNIEQFTGLKDKYGKDIYEGDIVQVDNSDEINFWMSGQICVIKYAPGRFQIYQSEFNKNMMQEDLQQYVKIIGNVSENQELVEKYNLLK